MSQVQNAVTSSRKGTPLSVSERKMRSVSRKREPHKPVNVFILNSHKDKLDAFCQENGLTQAEAIELLIKRELLGE